MLTLLIAKCFMCALGNRLIGSNTPKASNIYGYAFLSLGVWLGLPLWAWPLVLIGCVVWRSPSPRPWLDMTHTPAWKPALIRGLYILPLVAILAWFSMVYLFGLILVVVPCAVYWLAGKQTRYKPVALAEIFTGAIIPLAFGTALL